MREWLNAILSFIGAPSLTDDEYDSINFLHLENGVYNQAAYDELSKVLAARETMSTMQERLAGFFRAKGLTDLTVADTAKSQILVGIPL